MFYAAIDPAAPEPSRVMGFYDTGTFDYPDLPPHLVEMTPEQWAVRMERPFYQERVFVAPPPPSPAMLKAAALQALALELNARQASGVRFKLDSGDLVRIGTSTSAQAMNSQATVTGLLLDADGAPVVVTPGEAAAALAAVAAYLQACTRRYASLYAAVSKDPATDIKAGWPASGA